MGKSIKKEETYNITAMRPAILHAREKGNKGPISKSMCAELGISDFHFRLYSHALDKLFEAVSNYARIKNSPNTTDEERASALNTVFPAYKDFLTYGEKDRIGKDLRVSEHDVSTLVGFVQYFANDSNNVDGDESFIAKKAWAIMPKRQFIVKVETELGIKVSHVEVLSDSERDRLKNESKLLRGRDKCDRIIADRKAEREVFVDIQKKTADVAGKAAIQAQIDRIDADIKNQEEKKARFITKLSELARGMEKETGADKPETTPNADTNRRRPGRPKRQVSAENTPEIPEPVKTNEVSAEASDTVTNDENQKAA